MFKRILKIVGLSFCGVIGVFGIIVGVMAIRGDFKTVKVKPTGLYFSGDEKYFSDNKLLLSPVNDEDKFYFQVKAENEDCNVLGIKLSITSGADVIKIVDKNNLPITDAKIWSDVKIIPQTQGGINVGGMARISAISDDGLVATTSDLTVYVDIPVEDLVPSDDVKSTQEDNTRKTATRDKGPVDGKRYYSLTAVNNTFVEADYVLYDGKYYDYNSNTGEYKQVTTTDTTKYINLAELYEDCYMATMFNDNTLNVDTLYNFYPNSPNSQNPINRDGYGAKNVEAYILDEDDLQLATLSADGKTIISNGRGLTGDVRVLLAVYPTYAKQKLATADSSLSIKERIERYMISREIVVRIGATTIKDITITKGSLGLDLFEYTPLQLNNSAATNNLGMIIRDSANNPITSIYKYLKFSFVDSTSADANNLGGYFTITDENSQQVPDLADNVIKENLNGNTQLYIYAKRYTPKAYLKISYVSGSVNLQDVYVELVTSFAEPQISLNAGIGNINKLIDERLTGGINNTANIIDLAGYYTITPDNTVYRKVLYFAKSNETGLTPDKYPICVFANKTYTRGDNVYYLVGYTEGEGDNKVLVTDKLKANTGSGDISIIAVVVRTDYKGRIVNLNMPKDGNGEYVELNLGDDTLYDFNEAYTAADGENEQKSSAMATSALSLSVSIAYKVQNVNMTLSAKIGEQDISTDGDQKYNENDIVNGKSSNTFYLRERFDGEISLFVTDCYDNLALQTASNKGTIVVSAVMYDANGEYKFTGLDSIANYITIKDKTAIYDSNSVLLGYKYNVTLLRATPADCYISFKLSVEGYTQTFPRTIVNTDNTYELYHLDNLVILSGAVSSIDLNKNGDSVLGNNSEANPLILLAKWSANENNFIYTLADSIITSGTNFVDTGDFSVVIRPSYSLITNYTLTSSNTSVLSVDGSNMITVGSKQGKTQMTISCGGVEKIVYIELRLDTNSTSTISIEPGEAQMVGSGYIEVPLSNEYDLTSYTDYTIEGDSESHKSLLQFSNLIVKNERGEDVSNEKNGNDQKFQLIANKLVISGTINQKYYIDITVDAPYASSEHLKLYLHSAVTINYETYATQNGVYQQIYAGTTFILMDQSTETADAPIKIYVTDELAQFGGANGIKSVTIASANDGINFSNSANEITLVDKKCKFVVESSDVGKYVKFTIDFNFPADPIEYVVFVNDNLLVDEVGDAFINDGKLTAYCGENYNLNDYIDLKHFEAGEYADYSESLGVYIADPEYVIEEYPDLDVSTGFACNWDMLDSTLKLTYNNIHVLNIEVKNPYKIVQQGEYTATALTTIKVDEFIAGAHIMLLKKATSFDALLTYYNDEGREVVAPNSADIEKYFTIDNSAEFVLGFNSSDVLSKTDVQIGDLNSEKYIYVGKQTVPGIINFDIQYKEYDDVYGEDRVRIQTMVEMNVKPNLPSNFIKADLKAISGETVDLKTFINRSFEYNLFEWDETNNEPKKVSGEINLNTSEPFSSNDVVMLATDNTKFIAPEPTDPRGDLILNFTVNTDFGYSVEFSVTIKSSTQLIATYPTAVSRQKLINGNVEDIVYEQVVAGQTVDMFGVDNQSKITRIKATKNGSALSTPLRVKYIYDSGRDDTDATSLVYINNGSITFNTGVSAMFAVTITEPISGREILYYFYLAPSAEIEFTPAYSEGNTQLVKTVDATDNTLDLKEKFSLVVNGVDINKDNINYKICYATNSSTSIDGSRLSFAESNIENDYVVVIYDNTYIYGYYNIYTIPNVEATNTEIEWTPTSKGEVLNNNPTFTYNGNQMTVEGIDVDDSLSKYIEIVDNKVVLKDFVPNSVTGYLTYNLTMKSGEDTIGTYTHKVELTIIPRQYFADSYKTTSNALNVTVGDTFSLLNNEYNLAVLTAPDNGLTYEIKEIDGILYTSQELTTYFDEVDLEFTFKAVTKDVQLHFIVSTNFGYSQDLYINLRANIMPAQYTGNIGTVSNPLNIGNQTDGEGNFVFNRTVDLAEYLSIKDRKNDNELLTDGNFRITATILSSVEGLAVNDLYSLTGTTLTFIPLAEEIRLSFKIEILMSNDGSPIYFDMATMFYITLSANYNAEILYAFNEDASELVENGERVALTSANFLAPRESLTGVNNYNQERIKFTTTDTNAAFNYDKIATTASDINALSISIDSTTNENITAVWDSAGITFVNNLTTVGMITLRFKNSVGVDLTMNFKVYPANTLDAISVIKYNGESADSNNDHEMILEEDLSLSNDIILTTFGDSSSRVVFRYPTTEKSEFVASLKENSAVVYQGSKIAGIYDGDNLQQEYFEVVIDETQVVVRLNKDADGNIIYPMPALYTIHFLSRAGYLGSYNFTFSKDIYFENVGYNTTGAESAYGSQTGLYLLDRIDISLNPYTPTGYDNNTIDLIHSILSSADNKYNGYSLEFVSNSPYITIGANTQGTRFDMLTFNQVSKNTPASVTVRVLYNRVLIADHDYNFILKEHLIVSLGEYNSEQTTKAIDIYMYDFYNTQFYASSMDSVDYDLTKPLTITDGLYFTLYNEMDAIYASASDIRFMIDTNASTSGIGDIVTLNDNILTFKKDVTVDTILVLKAKHQRGEWNTFTITIKPSIAINKYTNGDSGYIYPEDALGLNVYSLDDLVLSSTSTSDLIDSLPKIESTSIKENGASPMGIYTVSTNGYTPLAENQNNDPSYTNVVSMGYAMFGSEEELNNVSTGYQKAKYLNLTVKYGSYEAGYHNRFSFTVPNVNTEKIMSVKVKIRLLGNVYYEDYYFIKVKPSLAIGDGSKYESLTTISTTVLKGEDTGANTEYILFNENGTAINSAIGLFYWSATQDAFTYDKFKNNVIFVITSVDNGLDNLDNNIRFDLTCDLNNNDPIKLTLSSDGKLFNNSLKLKLYVLAKDSRNEFEFGDGDLIKILEATESNLAKLEMTKIFSRDIEIKPEKQLGIYTNDWNEINPINTRTTLGLPIDNEYKVDFLRVGNALPSEGEGIDNSGRIAQLVGDNFNGSYSYSDSRTLVNNVDAYGWSINELTVTVAYTNFSLSRKFTYMCSNTATFVKVDYSTYNDRLLMSPEIYEGMYINNSYNLANAISLVKIETVYGSNMNNVTTLTNYDINITLAEDKYVEIFSQNTRWYTKAIDGKYQEFVGQFINGNEYYYYDEYTDSYRQFDFSKYTIYDDTQSSLAELATGQTLYINLKECIDNNKFTLPYEAWGGAITLSFNVTITKDGVNYVSGIRVFEISAKPSTAQG